MSEPLITCLFVPRLQLSCAVGSRRELLSAPIVIAPEPGGQLIGEVSNAAEAFGIHPGMRLGEALARCPKLTLLPPDPAGVAEHWERLLEALESIGAEVEPGAPGVACFDARGLLALHASGLGRGPLATPREQLLAVLAKARHALGVPVRFGVGSTRFVAVAAASHANARSPVLVAGGARELRAFLAPLPVELLRTRAELGALPEVLERLGIRTLGELAALPAAAVSDRFGRPGLLAYQLARGGDTPLRPRLAGERVAETLELPEAAGGQQLEHALGLMIDRLLARRERRGRTLRAVVLSARLVESGGTWRQQLSFREAMSDPVRIRLALIPRLQMLPAPAQSLRLVVVEFGSPTSEQRALIGDPVAVRAARLREAVSQARVAAGPEAALRVLPIDSGSRFPERRAVLAPFER